MLWNWQNVVLAGQLTYSVVPDEDDSMTTGAAYTESADQELRASASKPGKRGPIICKFCGLRLNTPSHLVTHERIHTGEKPFICPICNKGFKRKYHMKTHLVVHDNLYGKIWLLLFFSDVWSIFRYSASVWGNILVV